MRKILFILVLLATACARPVFDAQGAATGLTPRTSVAEFRSAEGRRVIWGGRIVESRNLENSTELVVLGFPLDRAQRPLPDEQPVGRFIVHYPDYLETAVFAPDRLVTVDARVADRVTRLVGQADYEYPVAAADAVHLWPEGSQSESRVHFGIGIGIHN